MSQNIFYFNCNRTELWKTKDYMGGPTWNCQKSCCYPPNRKETQFWPIKIETHAKFHGSIRLKCLEIGSAAISNGQNCEKLEILSLNPPEIAFI